GKRAAGHSRTCSERLLPVERQRPWAERAREPQEDDHRHVQEQVRRAQDEARGVGGRRGHHPAAGPVRAGAEARAEDRGGPPADAPAEGRPAARRLSGVCWSDIAGPARRLLGGQRGEALPHQRLRQPVRRLRPPGQVRPGGAVRSADRLRPHVGALHRRGPARDDEQALRPIQGQGHGQGQDGGSLQLARVVRGRVRGPRGPAGALHARVGAASPSPRGGRGCMHCHVSCASSARAKTVCMPCAGAVPPVTVPGGALLPACLPATFFSAAPG
ncbi:unnamed protein product, partial [Prorocentrum cordatum]